MSEITRDEWLKALGDAVQPLDPTAMSIMELSAMFGIGRMATYREVLRLLKAGRAVTTVKQITGPTGISRRVPAYKLVTPKKKK